MLYNFMFVLSYKILYMSGRCCSHGAIFIEIYACIQYRTIAAAAFPVRSSTRFPTLVSRVVFVVVQLVHSFFCQVSHSCQPKWICRTSFWTNSNQHTNGDGVWHADFSGRKFVLWICCGCVHIQVYILQYLPHMSLIRFVQMVLKL